MAKGPQPFGSSGRGPQRFGLFGGGVPSFGGEPRYFIKLPGVNQYFSAPDVSMPSDFSISVDVLLEDVGGIQFYGVLGSAETKGPIGSYSLVLRGDGRIYFLYGDGSSQVTLSTPTGTFQFDVLNTIVVARSGGTLSILLNGIEVLSSAVGGYAPTPIDRIGSYKGGNEFPGIIANLRIIGDNITSGGEPVDELLYPLDDSPNNLPVISEAINGKNGTYINGSTDDYGKFKKLSNGNWQGSDLSVPPWDSADQVIEVAE